MIRRPLGTTGFTITSIGIGTWAIGGLQWGGGQDDAESIRAIHAALDHGVNWIDTAPIYGAGHAEVIVGRALRQLPASSRPLVFSKFGLGQSRDAARAASRQDVFDECDASLKRLGVDQIDLLQLHWPAPQPMAETAEACADLLKAGKIRAVGVSNFGVAQLEEWTATGFPLHTLQPAYSILRPAAAGDVIPWCAARNVGVISYSPLFRGLLFGTWDRTKTFAADDARGDHKDYVGARFQRHLDAVDELKALAGRSGLSCAQLCVGVLLHTPGLTGVIVGSRNARQGALTANLGVAVTDEQVSLVKAIMARLTQDLATM